MSNPSHKANTVSTQTGLPTLFGRCNLFGYEVADRVEPTCPIFANPRYQRLLPPPILLTIS